jgi:glycosyltransferase involved in cell wall biosynthesis
MAAGCPVIAYKAGGALEYVVDGKTGLFFEEQTVDSLTKTLSSFKDYSFSEKVLKENAEKFNATNFRDNMMRLIKVLASSE